jgi:hypothetical protein
MSILTKRKLIFALSIICAIYILSIIVLLTGIELPADKKIRLIISVIAIIALLFINIRESSDFLTVLTCTALIYYAADPFYSVWRSIVNSRDLLFENPGFLSSTEGYIMFFGIAFLIFAYLKKRFR